MSIFGRLNYDSSFQNQHVTPMSDSVKKHMDGMPPLLNDWQKPDVATSNTANYHKNPVGTITQNIWDLANTIVIIPAFIISITIKGPPTHKSIGRYI